LGLTTETCGGIVSLTAGGLVDLPFSEHEQENARKPNQMNPNRAAASIRVRVFLTLVTPQIPLFLPGLSAGADQPSRTAAAQVVLNE